MSITNVDIITEMIADNVFLLNPLANIKEIIEKTIISITHKNNKLIPLKYKDKPI